MAAQITNAEITNGRAYVTYDGSQLEIPVTTRNELRDWARDTLDLTPEKEVALLVWLRLARGDTLAQLIGKRLVVDTATATIRVV